MVYASFSTYGRTNICNIRNGALTSQQNRGGIQKPIVAPNAGAIEDNFISMDDNRRTCRADLVDDFF